MKILILLISLLISSNLYSSQARILSLGVDEMDNEGSYYFDDERNIFLNAANVNDYSDMVIFEIGDKGYQVGINDTYLNQDSDPKAQGGFLLKSGKLTWGLYLNNVSNTAVFLRVLASSTALSVNNLDVTNLDANMEPQLEPMLLPGATNQIEVFFGWGDKLKWGVNFLFYTESDDTPGKASESKGAALRLGVKGSRWDAFANISLMNEVSKIDTATVNWGSGEISELIQHKFDGKYGFHVGGGYKFDKLRLYAYLKTFGWDQFDDYDYDPINGDPLELRTNHNLPNPFPPPVFIPLPTVDGGQMGTVGGHLNIFKLGIGNFIEMDRKTTFYWDLYGRYYNIKVAFDDATTVNAFELPIVFAIESKATDWLIIRGSILNKLIGFAENKNFGSLNPVAQILATQLFGGDNDGESSSLPNRTSVRVGASLVFGDLSLDGLMGSNGSLIDSREFFYRGAIYYNW